MRRSLRNIRDSNWPWVLALAFVILTLVALVFIPIIVQRRVDRARREIEASEPARTLVTALQFDFVQQLISLRDYVRTGDTRHAAAFLVARTAERDATRRLARLTSELGPPVHEQFVRARTLAERWHARIRDDELLRSRTATPSEVESAEVQELFNEILRTTAQLDSVIVTVTALRRQEIAAAERMGIQLTSVSGALAILAALTVAGLLIRIRRLAAESERRRGQAARALEESARAAEGRARLLRGVTHDVKNPLGAARGYAELLELGIKGPLSPEQQEMVKGVQRSVDSALAIISDLLDLARADSGGFHVERAHTNLNEVARDAVADHQAAAAAAGHVIELEAAPETLPVYTDPVRVRQVLDNLISNAIKYTPAPGRITIRTDSEARDAPQEGRAVAVRVIDTGPGIPEDKRDLIFDEFTRLEDHGAMKGHGLGLAIARRMARLLGGDLGVANTRGPGATFVLWLPQREQREQSR